jgi:hypothetical protein
MSDYAAYDESYPEDSSYFSSISQMYFLSLGCISSLPKIAIQIKYEHQDLMPLPQLNLVMMKNTTDDFAEFQISISSVLPLYQARLRLDAQVPLIFNSKSGKKWTRNSNTSTVTVLKEQTHEFSDIIQFKIPRHDLIFKNSNSFFQLRTVLDCYQFEPVQALLNITYPHKKVRLIHV